MTQRRGARTAAAQTVDRVLRSGAYSNVLVRTTTVDPTSDHGFYERLVFTTLRHVPYADRLIAGASSRSIHKVEALPLAVLRCAAVEYAVLGGSPHAVVNEAVESVRALGRPRAAGFVNAVMRSIASGELSHPRGIADAYPGTFVDLVRASLRGDEQDFLEASNGPAPVGLRVRPETAAHYGEVTEELRRDIAEGSIDVIDPASASVAVALDVEPGMSVLDLAAAPGGKTRAIADAAGPDGFVVAVDRHKRRLRSATQRPKSPDSIRWLVADAGDAPVAAARFDRVLLDAPCTGLGTLRRRPEIRFKVGDSAPDEYGALQAKMLEAASRLVKPGGRLVYSVCTVTDAETQGVVAGKGFVAPDNVKGLAHGDGLLLAPHTTGTDGMFIAVYDA